MDALKPHGTSAYPSGQDILIVDDDPADTALLISVLAGSGWQPRVAATGAAAVEMARARTPDLVLLDVQLPDMTGFQVCSTLRAERATSLVPVVIVTSLSDRSDRVTGIKAGADDFIFKPVDRDVLVARVSSLLKMRRLTAELERSLAEQRRLGAAKDRLTHLIIHDLRNPLAGLLANLDMLAIHLTPLSDKQKAILNDGRRTSRELMTRISSLLDVIQLEEGSVPLEIAMVDPVSVAREAVVTFRSAAERDSKNLILEAPESLPPIPMDRGLILRSIENLLTNALTYTPDNGTVRVRVGLPEPKKRVVCEVIDDGIGISSAQKEYLFRKIDTATAGGASTGLGLYLCRLAITAHGGRIWVESEAGKGSRFGFELPVEPRS